MSSDYLTLEISMKRLIGLTLMLLSLPFVPHGYAAENEVERKQKDAIYDTKDSSQPKPDNTVYEVERKKEPTERPERSAQIQYDKDNK